jgi:8-oxo-dGTP pyrophosphatase MutT (NUDIX family)
VTEASRPPIAAVAVVREDGAALLQLRDDDPRITHPGRWVFPGGHGRPGEDATVCAARELEEETAYRARDLVRLGPIDDPAEEVRGPIVLFLAPYDGEQAIECREGTEMRWVTRDEADALDVPRFLLDAWDDLVLPYLSARPDHLEARS